METITFEFPARPFWTVALLAGVLTASAVVAWLLPRTTKYQTPDWIAKLGFDHLPPFLSGLGLIIWCGLVALFLLGLAYTVIDLPGRIDTGADSDPGAYRMSLLTITAMTAGLSALIALPFTLIRTRQAERQTHAREQDLVTDRINKAVENLGAEKTVKRTEPTPKSLELRKNIPTAGSAPIAMTTFEETLPNMEVRIGALYALDRIARENVEFAEQVANIIKAYFFLNTAKADLVPATPSLDGFPTPNRSRSAKRESPPGFKTPRAAPSSAPFGDPNALCLQLLFAPDAPYDHRPLKIANRSLVGFDLSDLHIRNVQFDGCDLGSCIAPRTSFKDCRFERCSLLGIELDKTLLTSVEILHCALETPGEADEFSTMHDVYIRGSWIGALWFERARIQGLTIADSWCVSLTLNDVSASKIRLNDCVVRHLSADRATGLEAIYRCDILILDLNNADLRGACLDRSCFGDLDIRGADLKGATLFDSRVHDSAMIEGVRSDIAEASLKNHLLGTGPDPFDWGPPQIRH